MKVIAEQSVRYQVLEYIKRQQSNIILRDDLKNIAEPRQISRALNSLVQEGKIAKLAYGIYSKLAYSNITQRPYLPAGLVSLAREALTRLNIPWELSDAETAYNQGLSQQIPANPATKLQGRFRRKLSYNGIEVRFE